MRTSNNQALCEPHNLLSAQKETFELGFTNYKLNDAPLIVIVPFSYRHTSVQSLSSKIDYKTEQCPNICDICIPYFMKPNVSHELNLLKELITPPNLQATLLKFNRTRLTGKASVGLPVNLATIDAVITDVKNRSENILSQLKSRK